VDVHSAVIRLKQGLTGGNRLAVNSAARELIAAQARLGAQWQAIATALASNGEWSLALAAVDRLAVDTGNGVLARKARMGLLYEAGRFEQALAELDRIVAGDSTSVAQRLSDLNLRATLTLLLGRAEDARDCLAQALDLDPRSGQAWFTFSELADFRSRDESSREPLELAFAQGASLRGEAAKLAHAVGRMRHQLGDFAGSFDAYHYAAELFRSAPGSGARPQPDLALRSVAFPTELIERVRNRITVPHDRVIFVSGLPRSGTTLVEQMLVSHPDVAHGEELGFFPIIAREIGGIDADTFTRWLDSGGDPNHLVELYLHLADERFGPEGRFVDKKVEAGNYMGLLLALFPQSPIFWMLRDPLDNGWSAFRTMFAKGPAWSWDLEHIGQRLAQEQRMVEHWSNAAPERITFVDYDALVRDPEPHIRSIAKAAGLTFDEAMLSPHATERPVATASVNQVREPINLKGLGVSRPYRQWLQPVVDSFEAHSAAWRASSAGVSSS
jgi:tetratricopeptide (TPR) repeat protein